MLFRSGCNDIVTLTKYLKFLGLMYHWIHLLERWWWCWSYFHVIGRLGTRRMKPKNSNTRESLLLMVKGHTTHGMCISSEVLEGVKLWGISKDKGKERYIFLSINERVHSYKTLAFYWLLANHCPSHDEMKWLREVHLVQSPPFKEWDI